jgi:hypothetical protein
MSWPTPIAGQSWTVSAAVTGTLLPGVPRTGTLTLTSLGTVLASVNIAKATPNSSGYYSLTLPSGLPAGFNALELAYSGDAHYAAVTRTFSFTVANDALSVSFDDTAVAGQPVTVGVAILGPTINGAARTGTISLVEGTTTLASIDVSKVKPNSSGYYPLVIAGGLSPGSHIFQAVYSGNATYNSFTTGRRAIDAVVATSLATAWPAPIAGQSWTMSVAIGGTLLSGTPRTGTLTLTSGNTVLASINIANVAPGSSGYYALAVPGGLPAGQNALQLTYSGDAHYAAATTSMSFPVANDALSVSCASTVVAGKSFTVGVAILGPTIGGTARTGTISVMEGNTVLATIDISKVKPNGSGYYSVTIAAGLPLGSHSLKVVYSGNATYNSVAAGPISVDAVAASATATSLGA